MKKYLVGLFAVFVLGIYAWAAYNEPPASSQSKIQFTDKSSSGYPDVIQYPRGTITQSGGIFTLEVVVSTNTAPRTNITPTHIGQLILDVAANDLCVATGTTVTSWAQVKSTGTPCAH